MARLMAEQLGFDFFFPVYQQKDFNKVKNPIPRNSSVLEWIQELPNKDPSLREPAEKVLSALTPEILGYLQDKNPSYYLPAGNRLSLENRFKRSCELMKAGKELDKKGNKLLARAGALRILASTVFDISQNTELLKQSGLTQADVAALFEIERKADNDFFKHRDSLKHNKDGSLKLEDFGEDLNNTRKGKVRVNRQSNQFLYDEQSELEKRLSREPLDSVWPKDSIIELQKINPKAAACLWLVRGTMSGRKPAQSSPRYQGYLKTALTAIGLHRQVLFGEDAPEVGDVRAFDRFYGIGKESYEVLSLADGKFWPFLRMGVFRNAKAIPTANDWKLSDGSDINDYPFQIAVGFNENNAKEKHPLCFLDEDGERIPYIAVVVGKDEEEFKQNLNRQLSISLQRYLEAEKQEDEQKEDKPKKISAIRLFGRGDRQSHTYEIYGKQGSIELQLTERIAFKSDADFWDYVLRHQEEFESKYLELRTEYSKSEKDWRGNSPIRERIGTDWRQGKDATPEMFMSTFGFRGVEFGNWVKQGKHGRERQWMLNNAFDSLKDLAEILNIPPKAVALNGELGLCFGSRGFGSASAHYDPQNRLINLTKTKGYSSLAHEWFHALDHHMACDLYEAKLFESKFLSDKAEPVRFGLSEAYKENLRRQIEAYSKTPDAVVESIESKLTSNPLFPAVSTGLVLETVTHHAAFKDGRSVTYSLKHQITKDDLREIHFEHETKLRPQVFHAWGDVVEAIRASSMHQRMKKKNAYWQSKIEESARSFEAFVQYRCKELNIQNDFLTNAAFSEKSLGKDNFYPYLDGEDVKKVCDKFRELFAVIKNKETKKGVELYSREITEKVGTPRLDIRELLTKEFGENGIVQLIKANKLYIAQNQKEALFIHATKEREGNFQTLSVQEPLNEKVLGFYDPKRKCSYIVADNLTKENAVAVVLHEIGVHMSRDSQFKERTERLITQANELFQEGLKGKDPLMEKVQKRLSDSNVHPFFKNYKEEVCGYLIEEAAKEINKTPKVQRWFQEVTSTVKVWLSEHGVLDVSRLKTQDLVTIAKANVKEIARQKPEVKLSPEGMKVLAEHVKAMNFKYSKITDAEPEIKTLYRKFVELEQAGKPLPKAAVVEKRTGGMQR